MTVATRERHVRPATRKQFFIQDHIYDAATRTSPLAFSDTFYVFTHQSSFINCPHLEDKRSHICWGYQATNVTSSGHNRRMFFITSLKNLRSTLSCDILKNPKYPLTAHHLLGDHQSSFLVWNNQGCVNAMQTGKDIKMHQYSQNFAGKFLERSWDVGGESRNIAGMLVKNAGTFLEYCRNIAGMLVENKGTLLEHLRNIPAFSTNISGKFLDFQPTSCSWDVG